MSIKGFVLAGTFREYVVWLQENEKNRSEYPYIGEEEGIERMRGMCTDTPVYLVGTFRDHVIIYKFIKSRFHDLRKDTLPLGFNAQPEKYRYEDEVTATIDENYHD